MHRLPFALVSLALAAASNACASHATRSTHPAVASDGALAATSIAADPRAEECRVLVRGAGGAVIRDTRITEHWPADTYGDADAAFAGSVGGGRRDVLIQFELPPLPPGAVIERAALSLQPLSSGPTDIAVHRVVAAWSERDTTWSSFAGAYDARVAAHVTSSGDETDRPRRLSVDVTALVRAWAEGGENHGVLLEQSHANTAFATSEADDLESRPRVEICYRRLRDATDERALVAAQARAGVTP